MSTSDEELMKFIAELKNVLHKKSSDPSGPTYQSLRKLHAKCLLRANMKYEAAFNLVESLAPSVRTMATYRCEKMPTDYDTKQKMDATSYIKNELVSKLKDLNTRLDSSTKYFQEYNKNCLKPKAKSIVNPNQTKKHLERKYVRHFVDDDAELPKMRENIKELPQEWTIVQLTAGYEPTEQWQSQRVIRTAVKEYYLTVLKNNYLSSGNLDPFTACICPDMVKYGETPVFEELHSTLEENLYVIENNVRLTNNCIKKYWEKRGDCDLRIKGIISAMDKKWLGGFRCLLSGNLLSKQLDDDLKKQINQACVDKKITISPVQRMLLFSLANNIHSVSPSEISLFLRKVYMEHAHTEEGSFKRCKECGDTKWISEICIRCGNALIAASSEFKKYRKTFIDIMESIKNNDDLKNAKRGPVILLVDEKLDMFPWEMLPILTNHPVSRMECLSFVHALYKAHEHNFSGGYFKLQPTKGRYLINPGGDLKCMEKRMCTFIDYWCPGWEGDRNVEPSPGQFQKFLQESDVFLYCGHNDGSQYIGGGPERLEGARAVTTLSGCGSVRLRPPGTRLLPLPVHSYYHIATCPAVIGMLWEVTDLEVDKVTSMLLGMFLPSEAPRHWGDVNKTQWTQGILDTTGTEDEKFMWEPDMLRALAYARRSSRFAMIAASIVARGLPVLIGSSNQAN